jgi:hypothetical protein
VLPAFANLLIAGSTLIACGYALWHQRFSLALVGFVLTLSTSCSGFQPSYGESARASSRSRSLRSAPSRLWQPCTNITGNTEPD